MIKKLKGFTLLEAMLGLAIASTIALLAVKQFTQYKRDRDAFSLKYKVDTIFQGMRNYYYANCAESTDPDMSYHTLAPSRNPSNPFPMDVTNQLNGYLDADWRPTNPLIDSSFANSGYQTQFNNTIITSRNENFCYYFPGSGQTSPNCASLSNTVASFYLWVAQVVVKVRDTKTTLVLKGLTDADCALDTYAPFSIVNCSTGATSGNPAYLVWQRLPSVASPGMSAGLSSGAYTVKVFTLQYTNDSFWGLVSRTSQYFLCGG